MNILGMNSGNSNNKKETKSIPDDETNEEKTNLNITMKSNLKFNSELLNKPFGTFKMNNNEKNFSNFDNQNNFNQSSTSDFFRNENNDNNISKISFSGSINFNKSNEFNSSILDSKGKRKPFEKLTFNLSASEQNKLLELSGGFGLSNTSNLQEIKNDNRDKGMNTGKTNSNNAQDENNLIKEDLSINKSKKEVLKVENFGKIQNRIKETINTNKKLSNLDHLPTELYENSTITLRNNGSNSDLKNKIDRKENKNQINVDSIFKNNDINNKFQRLNTDEGLIHNASESSVSLKSSRKNQGFKDRAMLNENSKNYSANKNKITKDEKRNYKNNESFENSKESKTSIGENFHTKDKNPINKKEFSKMFESQSIVKCMEETHLTEINNLNRGNYNYEENANQTNLINNNNRTTDSQINFQNQSNLIKKINSSNNEINTNPLVSSMPNQHDNCNNISELNESNLNEISYLNKTNISKIEQSIISKSKSKFLSQEEIEKAKLFNYQFDNKIPFWIKFFIDFDQNPNSLQSNSSFFKANDKNKYVKDLIEMVKQDAKLYDASQKEHKKKVEGKQILKSLLLTEVKLTNANPFNDKSKIDSSSLNVTENIDKNSQINNTSLNASRTKDNHERNVHSLIQEESKCPNESIEKSYAEANLTQEEIEMNEKFNKPINKALEGILNQYEKIEKSEAKKKVENFSEFKTRLSKKESVKDKYGLKSTDRTNSVLQSAMNRFSYPNLVDIKESLNDDERIFKTIDNLKFPEIFDPFMELDYSQLQLGYLDKADLQRLFDIDKKLHEINPDKYSESINTDLYIMQMEFNEGKEERLKEIEKEYKEKMARIKNKEVKKPSVFDVKQEDNTKPIYKDYLQEMKTKKDLKNDLFEIDNKIRIIRNQEIPEERKNEIFEDLNLYYAKNSEYYEKEMTKRIPEDFNFDLAESSMKEINCDLAKLKADLEEFDRRIAEKDPDKTYEKIEIEKKQEIKQEMLKNYERAIDMLENIHLENQEKMKIVEKLERKVLEDEVKQKELDEKYKLLIQEKEKFEENLQKLDGLLNEEYEFESYMLDDNENDGYNDCDDDKLKELPFEELEKKAFYEFEDI